ncbi:MAG: transaldolase [Desulfobaccales bacterium]
MLENPLIKLRGCGQSVWLDNLSRHLLNSGDLQRLIDADGLGGVTSNPAIFEKAIVGSPDYDDDIGRLSRQGQGTQEIYETLTVSDVQRAADLLLPVFRKLEGTDGFVSLEVNPHLAHDTSGTIAEARRLWGKLDRPNVFIKVPATHEGLPAIRQLISEGINVNVTLLFGLPRYREVAEAYTSGLEERTARGEHLRVASVASFFLSRIDTLVDQTLKRLGGAAAALEGEVAIASAKVAYAIYRQLCGGDRFKALQEKGARPQRLLWASTSTKNPAYSDVKYVEPLIGPETINTMPQETINAYRDHGQPASRLSQGADQAAAVLQRLPELGIDLNQVTQQLEDEGVEKFNQPYDKLLESLEGKRRQTADGGSKAGG